MLICFYPKSINHPIHELRVASEAIVVLGLQIGIGYAVARRELFIWGSLKITISITVNDFYLDFYNS